MIARILTLLLALMFLGWVTDVAAEPPPKVALDAITWPALSKEKPTSKLTMGSFSVLYERTTLATIQKEIGSGAISHHGDAAESLYWLCYTGQSERIWIMAHGEMGGSKHRVTSVAAESMEHAEATNDCPVLPSKFQPITFDNDLWLGITEESVLQILGKPSHREDEWLYFDYEEKKPAACKPEDADVSNWVFLKKRQGRVIQIHSGQVTSC